MSLTVIFYCEKNKIYHYMYFFFIGHQFAVLDLPLLFESGKMVRFIHKTIVVAWLV